MIASPMNFSTTPPCCLELGAHRVEVARHHLAQRLGVELLAHRGRALEVREDDRDDLPDLLRAAVARVTSGDPHARQNFATSGFSVPHCEQNGI